MFCVVVTVTVGLCAVVDSMTGAAATTAIDFLGRPRFRFTGSTDPGSGLITVGVTIDDVDDDDDDTDVLDCDALVFVDLVFDVVGVGVGVITGVLLVWDIEHKDDVDDVSDDAVLAFLLMFSSESLLLWLFKWRFMLRLWLSSFRLVVDAAGVRQ